MSRGNSSRAVPRGSIGGPDRRLREDELNYRFMGPGHFTFWTSNPYPNGKRVYWTSGSDRLLKLDYDTFEILAEYKRPGAEYWSEEESEAALNAVLSQPEDTRALPG